MTDNKKLIKGSIGWVDLTIDNADAIRNFYEKVIGWKSAPVSMGKYNDYTMVSPDNDIPYAGVCHNEESNKGLPPY